MSAVITGKSPDYSAYDTDPETVDGPTAEQRGATETEPYTVMIGENLVIRAKSQEELDNFMAWMSSMSGKPVNELTEIDALRYVSASEFSDSFVAHDPVSGNTFTSFGLEESRWTEITTFDDKHFFGNQIPEFPAGSGAFFGASINPDGDKSQLGVSLSGFEGTAQMIYNTNYPSGSEVKLLDMSTIDPDVQTMLEFMFGPNTAFTQEHMNVLKMMNIVYGTVPDGVANWKLTPDTGHPLLNAQQTGATDFIPSVSLLSLESVDITTGKEVASYFDEGGNFIEGFSPADIDKKAAELLAKTSPPDAVPPVATPLPANVVMGERVATTLNTMYNLPPGNTAFTAEQVNAAILMGLVKFDPASATLTLTGIGRGYVVAKNPEGMNSAGPVGATASEGEPTEADNLQLLWNDWNTLATDHNGDSKGDGVQMVDFLESKYPTADGKKGMGNNGQFGQHGVQVLSTLTVNSVEWEESGLSHLSTTQRQEMIDAAKSLPGNSMYTEQWIEIGKLNGGGNNVDTAINFAQLDIWLNNTKDTWKPDLEAIKSRYQDPDVTVPANTSDFFLPDEIGIKWFGNAEWEAMNKVCQDLFRKSFDQMSQDERKKALYVLSTGAPPMITLDGGATEWVPKDEIDDGDWEEVLTVDFTTHGSDYANSLT